MCLSRSRDAILDGEMRKEGVDFRGRHLSGVAFVVEQDEASGPIVVAVFGAVREVPNLAGRAQPIEQLGLLLESRCWECGDYERDGNRAEGRESNELCGIF